jgi:hypothetical protein
MGHKEDYDHYNDEDRFNGVELIGSKKGIDAINDLNKADQKEVYRFYSYSEGIFNYMSEDNTRLIAIGFSSQSTGITLSCFETTPDILLLRGRDYIEIRLFSEISDI